jgi:hypothetical protein
MTDRKTFSFPTINSGMPAAYMPIPLTSIRDMLFPGLQAISSRYLTNASSWYLCFDPLRPRIEAETIVQAKERARGLLRNLLTPEQWAELEKHGKLTERINGGKFELTPGGMITARKGKTIERWCVNPDPHAAGNDFMPREDLLIGQLLHLRADPAALRAQANIFPG